MKKNVYEFEGQEWGPYTLHVVGHYWAPISHRGPATNDLWYAETPAKVVEKMKESGKVIEHRFDSYTDQAEKVLEILKSR